MTFYLWSIGLSKEYLWLDTLLLYTRNMMS